MGLRSHTCLDFSPARPVLGFYPPQPREGEQETTQMCSDGNRGDCWWGAGKGKRVHGFMSNLLFELLKM